MKRKTNLIICCAAIALLFSTFGNLQNLNAQNYFPSGVYEQNLTNFTIPNGQWYALYPTNNTLGANAYQGINFGFDRNNYVSLVNGAGNNELYFGRWAYGWHGWNKIWHSGNLNRTDVDFFAKTITVAGIVNAREIIVNANAGADFVFESDYRLRPLAEVEQFITENKHLPDIAPAAEMIQNGVNMGEFQIQLLQKIEELTLYIIELKKEIDELKK